MGPAYLWEAGQDDLLQKEEFAVPPSSDDPPPPFIGAKPVKLYGSCGKTRGPDRGFC